MKIAHFSDLHLCAEHGGARQTDLMIEMVQDAEARGARHLVFTGDLVEYANLDEAKHFLRRLARRGWGGDRVTLVPGNHDIFPGSKFGRKLWRAEEVARNASAFARLASRFLDDAEPVWADAPFPFLRPLSPSVLLIGFDSTAAHPALPHRSALGYFHPDDAETLSSALVEEEHRIQRWRVLAMHHWPVHWRLEGTGGWIVPVHLTNRDYFEAWLGRHDVDLVLAGHQHEFEDEDIGASRVLCSGCSFEPEGRIVEYSVGYHLVSLGRRLSVAAYGDEGEL